MQKSLKILAQSTAVAALMGATLAAVAPTGAAQEYDPQINPADFSATITNPLFNWPIGKRTILEANTEEGEERIEITITGETKQIMGITALVYRDRAFLNGQLIEDTRDYIAQDKQGNVWYFGEDVNNFENGKLADHDGTWIAGVDGAKPGIWFPANPQIGDEYRQEFYKGFAEDMVEVLAVNQTVTTKLGTFEGCVQTFDWTPLDPESREHKFYCAAPGGVALITNLTTGEREELAQLRLDGPTASHDDDDGGQDDDHDDKDDDYDDDDDETDDDDDKDDD